MTSVGKAVAAKRMFGATPAQAEPKYIAMGVGATGAGRTAAVGDTALSTEVETRTAGTGSTVTTSARWIWPSRWGIHPRPNLKN